LICRAVLVAVAEAKKERLGITLVQRTTRSVRLTKAGERLYAVVRPALEDVQAVVAALGEVGHEPRGTLRLHVATTAESFLSGGLLADFLAAHRHVQLDFVVSDEQLDIVAKGYDGGIRLGEVIEQDMVACRYPAIYASSSLVLLHTSPGPRSEASARPGRARVPQLASDGGVPPYRWEFTEKGQDFSVGVRARVLTNEPPAHSATCPRGRRACDGVRDPGA
jgi:DNA-binding transcriptional LysR family regulator